jgi:hypothetical protein
MPSWTDEEDEILKTHYPVTPKDELSSLLSNHTWNAIKVRAHGTFGLKRNKAQFARDRGLSPWSQNEVEALKKFYPTNYTDEIAQALPSRTWSAIETRAMELGIHRKLDRRFEDVKTIRLREVDLGYIAAMIDGEGSITLSRLKRGGYVSGISIANNCKSMLEWIKSCIKRGKIYPKSHNSKCYALNIRRNSDQIALLQAVMPYLKVKHKQAELALKFLEAQRKSRRLPVLKGDHAYGTSVIHHPDEEKAYEEYSAYRDLRRSDLIG